MAANICPRCPNTTLFIGYDHNGYGGPSECGCGAFDDDGELARGAECSCSTVLRQPFTVIDGATIDGYDGEIVYEAFEGGGHDAEIGSYDTIECGACGAIIWNETPPEDA